MEKGGGAISIGIRTGGGGRGELIIFGKRGMSALSEPIQARESLHADQKGEKGGRGGGP